MLKEKYETWYRHSGGISVRVHDDIWTDACVTEWHVLLWDDETTNTCNVTRANTHTQTHTERKKSRLSTNAIMFNK